MDVPHRVIHVPVGTTQRMKMIALRCQRPMTGGRSASSASSLHRVGPEYSKETRSVAPANLRRKPSRRRYAKRCQYCPTRRYTRSRRLKWKSDRNYPARLNCHRPRFPKTSLPRVAPVGLQPIAQFATIDGPYGSANTQIQRPGLHPNRHHDKRGHQSNSIKSGTSLVYVTYRCEVGNYRAYESGSVGRKRNLRKRSGLPRTVSPVKNEGRWG